MPERSINISERWDDSGAPDGYRWRIGHETGVLDEGGYQRVEAAVRAAIADNADSVKLPEAGASHGPASDATIWLRNAMKERLAMMWDDVPDGVGAALTHLFTAPDAQAVLRRWLAEQPNHDDVTPEPDPAPLPPEVVAAVDASVDAHLDEAQAKYRATMEKLLADWFEGALARISEHGTSRDWPALIDDAKARHEALRVPWSNTFVPGYVREILALDDDEPIRTWTYSQINPGGADVSHGHTFTGTDAEWTEHQSIKVHEGCEVHNARVTP